MLRAYGVDGADAEGVPLVNTCVDRYLGAGAIGHGIAWWLGRALARGRSQPAGGRRGARLRRRSSTTARAARRRPRCCAALAPHTAQRARPHRRARAQRRAGAQAAPRHRPDAAEVRHRRHRQHLRRRRPGARRRAGRRRHHRRHPLDRAVAPRLRALRRHHRGLRRHLGHAGELPDRPHRARRRAGEARALPHADELLVGPVHARDRLAGRRRAARHAAQRRDVRHPLPRHQPAPHVRAISTSRGGSSRAPASSSTPARTTTSPPPTPSRRRTPSLASQFINEAFAKRAGLPDEQMGLGHAFEIDKSIEDCFLMEMAQAQLVRQIFPRHPIKWMPPTKHKTGDIFWSHRVDGAVQPRRRRHRPVDRAARHDDRGDPHAAACRTASSRSRAPTTCSTPRATSPTRSCWNPDGRIVARAKQVLGEARDLLREVEGEGMFAAIARGAFADVKRPETGGRGLAGVVEKATDYVNPILDALEGKIMSEMIRAYGDRKDDGAHPAAASRCRCRRRGAPRRRRAASPRRSASRTCSSPRWSRRARRSPSSSSTATPTCSSTSPRSTCPR